MKILVLIHEFPPVGGGGGPIARDLSHEWVVAGHQVRVVTAHYGDLAKKDIIDGVEVIRLPSNRKEMFRAGIPAMMGYIFAALRYCLFSMKDFQPDLLHVHFAVPAGPVGMIVGWLLRRPYVLTAHLGDIPGASPEKTGTWFKFVFPFTPPIWKNAARVVAVSEYSKSMALKSYAVPIDVIYNGIDYQKIHAPAVHPHSVTQIVFAGRFVPQKNLQQIVATCSRLRDLSWHCTLIGDGQDKNTLLGLIAEAGLEDRFSLPGWKTPEEVIAIFQDSDILFLPSRSEGLPVVGIQAMACGLALVLGDAGGNPEILTPLKNGFLEDPDDTDAFERDLRTLLTDPEKLLAYRSYSLEAAKAFDIHETAKQYEALFSKVV